MLNLSYITVGLLVGVFCGFLGLGGGLIAIPVLVYCYGLTQHQAQGTSLAMMVPPITILAAIRYYCSGNVRLGMAALLAAGFIVGGLLGAHIVQYIPNGALKKIFGTVLFLVSLRMIFLK